MVQFVTKDLILQPAPLVGSYDRTPVQVCLECGSVVFNLSVHEEFHEKKGNT